MTKRWLIPMVLLLAFLLIGQAPSAHACTATPSPTPGGEPPIPITLEDRINVADIVLLGTVIRNQDEAGYPTIAEVEVERYYKGDGADIMLIQGFGYSSQCLASVTVATQYIFLVHQRQDGTYWASYFQGYAPLINPSPENISQITALTNQSNPPSSIVSDTSTESTNIEMIALVASLLILGLTCLALLALRLRRDPRKSKAKRA